MKNVRLAMIMTDTANNYPVSFENLEESWDWLVYSAIMDNIMGSSLVYFESAKDIFQALGEVASTHAFYGKKAAIILQYFWSQLRASENLLDCIKSSDEKYLKMKIKSIHLANGKE